MHDDFFAECGRDNGVKPDVHSLRSLAPLARRRVRDDAIRLPTVMVLGKVLRDGQPFRRDEQQAVAELVTFHLVAGAEPLRATRDFGLLVRVEIARAERPTELVGPLGPAPSERLACGILILGPRTLYPPHRHEAYEVYVPADRGTAMWEMILERASPLGIKPYGLEALASLRIEKGHVAGLELDHRNTLADLGLAKMASRTRVFFWAVAMV